MHTLDALDELLTPVATTVFHLGNDIAEEGSEIHIYQLPGMPTGRSWESIDRIKVDIYATGYDYVRNLSNQASEILTGCKQTSFGNIDAIEVEVPMSHEPFDHDKINKFTGTYLITYRH